MSDILEELTALRRRDAAQRETEVPFDEMMRRAAEAQDTGKGSSSSWETIPTLWRRSFGLRAMIQVLRTAMV